MDDTIALVAYDNFSRCLTLVFPSVLLAEAEGFEPPRQLNTDLTVFKTALFTSLSIPPSDAPLLNAEIWGKSYDQAKQTSRTILVTHMYIFGRCLRPTSGAGVEGIEPTPNG